MEPVKKSLVYTENPFSYNYVALKKSKVDEMPLPAPQTLIAMNPYHSVAKYFGMGNVRDWENSYDKIFKITEWVKERTNRTDAPDIIEWLEENTPLKDLGANKVDYFYTRIMDAKNKSEA